ncbi:MAG TPA: RNA polymerase sigma factor [Edaphobacter sp.]|nr:RNA polymerase sigma factor [Edaphobacter sp.]
MPGDSKSVDFQRSVDAVWRIESARLIASLTRIVRDVGLAEDLAQDALVAALERWPKTGIPHNPGAWLMAAAKNRAIDLLRRNKLLDRKHEQLGYELESTRQLTPDQINDALDDPVGDDLLRLIFISCHPILAPEARVALTLRLLGGLTTDEIARAFLAAEPTIAQRIVRAKRTLTQARIPFEVPRGDEFTSRLTSVLQVIYLIFNEGYSATAGDDWTRPALCEEALRLGRILAELVPSESEVHGLVALMEIQASRLNARVGPGGEPILLLDQDRSRWDQILIQRGLSALEHAQHLLHTAPDATPRGGSQKAGSQNEVTIPAAGPYTLQAAIAACHARALTAEATDWHRIVQLYTQLLQLNPSPIIELNRAVAVSMASGPAAALPLIDALAGHAALSSYHLLPSVRGDLLQKLGRPEEARAEFERAMALTRNERERTLLLERAKAVSATSPGEASPACFQKT